jgi:uncharacterized protein YbaR (Trm112 family)
VQLLLTDRLSCPRCGPAFGLILLADRLTERRVHQGALGCPNCRDSFPIVDGFADLRSPPRGELEPGLAGMDPPALDDAGSKESEGRTALEPVGAGGERGAEAVLDDEASRTVALLGIPRGPGTVALVGAAARFAPRLVGLVEDLEAVAVDPDAQAWPERVGVSRLASRPGLPFFDRTLRGAVVDGRLGRGMIWEAARVTAPLSRVVVLNAPPETAHVLREAGLGVLAEEGETVVAARG